MNQLSLFTRRKARKPPPAPEVRTHIALADRIAWDLKGDWWCSHIPSGEHRSATTGALLKRMGTKKGMADFMLLGPGRICYLELKRKGNRLTIDQRIFQQAALSAGAHFAVAYSYDEAMTILNEWNCLRRIVHDT